MDFEEEIKLKRFYFKNIVPVIKIKVREFISEFKKENYENYKQMRLNYLTERKSILTDEIVEMYSEYEILTKQDKPYFDKCLVLLYLPDIQKQLKKVDMEIRILNHIAKDNSLTPDEIAQARDYPLSKLIEARGTMAICPFHNDKNPSMSIKNNFYYCFSCHAHGDVIDFVMKTKGLDFKSAVKSLL